MLYKILRFQFLVNQLFDNLLIYNWTTFLGGIKGLE